MAEHLERFLGEPEQVFLSRFQNTKTGQTFIYMLFRFWFNAGLQIGQNFHQGAFFKPHFVSMKEQMFLRCRSIIPAEKARECKLWTLIASRTGLLPPTASSLASYKVMFGSNVQTLNIWQIGTDVQIFKNMQKPCSVQIAVENVARKIRYNWQSIVNIVILVALVLQ